MARSPDSGELFAGENFDLRAFLPAPGSQLDGAIAGAGPCQWEVYAWSPARHRRAWKANCNSTRSFRYRVNRWIEVDLCRFHARLLGRRRGLLVEAISR